MLLASVYCCQNIPSVQASDDVAWIDLTTGLVWHKQSCRSFRERFGGPDALTLFFAKSWISHLNNKKTGGYSDWRLPSVDEYKRIFREGAGQVVYEYRSAKPMPLYTLGYLPPVEGKRRYAWSRDGNEEQAASFDFVSGKMKMYPRELDVTYEFDALAVRGSITQEKGEKYEPSQ
ncbi:DUF1566 domain-containing protein [Mariprofundus sp. NF]|uniref:Lcl domain-containing protein n=1 Tax=Mariprofundus sp. NF TaxID=2608716 RepID=UPI0015A365F1|nr:DUF1566 domain-containing protein [Mariprofundus sp. NF]NWF38426.1 DUF1566 domain-containing protein [Mariprofundus sp. NF]